GLLDQQRELRSVSRRSLGQNLAVQFDSRQLQAMNQSAVGKASLAGCRADTHDPQRAVLALLLLAAGIGELERALHRFLRGTVQFAFSEEVALGKGKRSCAAVRPLGTTFNSG